MHWPLSRRPRSLAGFLVLGAELAVVTLGSIVAFSTNAWRRKSLALLGRLLRWHGRPSLTNYDLHELEDLPAPVARYFRAVLHEGERIVRSAELSQRGHFLLPGRPPVWKKFHATQHIVTAPLGFLWDASIRVAPGISVLVRDALIDGIGSMRASVMGLWPLRDIESSPEITAGALQRALAEAPWVPTSLLPSQGVCWTPLDDESARATVTAGETRVCLDFFFAGDGTVCRIYTDARSRDVDGHPQPTPWQGHFSRYAEMSGMKIPLHAEVEWLLEEGQQTYWRADITSIAYEHF